MSERERETQSNRETASQTSELSGSQKGVRGAAAILAGRIATMLIAPLVSIFLVRNLPTEEYGSLKLAGNFLFAASVLTSFGLGAMLDRYGPVLWARHAFRFFLKLLLGTVLVRTFFLLVFVFAISLGYPYLEKFLNLPPVFSSLLPWIQLYVFFSIASGFFAEGALTSVIDHSFIALSRAAVNILVSVLLVLVLYLGCRLRSVLQIQTAGVLVLTLVFAARAYWHLQKNLHRSNDERLPYGRMGRYAFFSMLTVVSYSFRDLAIDNFIISHYIGIEQVAFYGFAGGLVLSLNHLSPSEILRGLMTPLASRNYAKHGDINQIVFFHQVYLKVVVFAGIPLLLLTFIFSESIIIHVFDPRYLPALLSLRLLLFFWGFRFITIPFNMILYVLERNDIVFYAAIFSIYNLVMDLLLVPRFGIVGAALATGSSCPLVFIYYWIAVKRYLRVPLAIPWNSLFRSILNLMALALMGYVGLRWSVGLVSTLGIMALVSTIYLGICSLNRVFDNRERQLLNQAFGRNLWIF